MTQLNQSDRSIRRSIVAVALVTAYWLAGPAAQELSLPQKPDSVRFGVIGDNGTGATPQYEVAQQLSAYHGKFPFTFVIMLGDNLYGSERPQDIAADFARRVQQEANGWGSEAELMTFLKAQSPTVADDLIRAHARSATKTREDGRLVWKRDPNLVKGFVPTELWQAVRQIKSPTLYILGGKSTIVSVATQQQLKSTIPGCEIVVMPGLGHYPHLEAPADYVDLVAEFLSRRAPSH